jgi:hypothetical protein
MRRAKIHVYSSPTHLHLVSLSLPQSWLSTLMLPFSAFSTTRRSVLPSSSIHLPHLHYQISPPLAAILALTELIQHSDGLSSTSTLTIRSFQSSRYHVRTCQGPQRRCRGSKETSVQSNQLERRLRTLHRVCHLVASRLCRMSPAISSLDLYFSIIARLELHRSEEGTHPPGPKLCG